MITRMANFDKTIDDVSASISSNADQFSNMAVLAESVSNAHGLTATALAEMPAKTAAIAGAADPAIAGGSALSNENGYVCAAAATRRG